MNRYVAALGIVGLVALVVVALSWMSASPLTHIEGARSISECGPDLNPSTALCYPSRPASLEP